MNDLEKIKKTFKEVGIVFHVQNGELMNGTPLLYIMIEKKSLTPNYDEDGDLLLPYIIFDTNGNFMTIDLTSE